MKEVIYTAIFIFLGIVFLVLLAIMFLPNKTSVDSSSSNTESSAVISTEQSSSSGQYTPGIYSVTLEVSGTSLEIQVIVEKTSITDVSFTHLD